MKQPYAPLLTNMNGYLGIVSPTAVQKMGMAEFARHPVGSGPFMFKEWVQGPRHTGAEPRLQLGLVHVQEHRTGLTGPGQFKIIPEPSVRTGTLKTR